MSEEERNKKILKRIQNLAESHNLSFQDLIELYEFGAFFLEAWRQEGIEKEPDEVLHLRFAWIQESMRRIAQEEQV